MIRVDWYASIVAMIAIDECEWNSTDMCIFKYTDNSMALIGGGSL